MDFFEATSGILLEDLGGLEVLEVVFGTSLFMRGDSLVSHMAHDLGGVTCHVHHLSLMPVILHYVQNSPVRLIRSTCTGLSA